VDHIDQRRGLLGNGPVEDFRGGEIEGGLEMRLVEFKCKSGHRIGLNPSNIYPVENDGCVRIFENGWPDEGDGGWIVTGTFDEAVQKINEALADDHCFGCCHESDPVPFTTNSDDGPWFAEEEDHD
jgi:hypothetical protein